MKIEKLENGENLLFGKKENISSCPMEQKRIVEQPKNGFIDILNYYGFKNCHICPLRDSCYNGKE